MSRFYQFFVVIFTVSTVAQLLIRPDRVIDDAINAMNSNSRFAVNTGGGYDFKDIPVKGVLGPFYQCLKAYEKINSHRRENGKYRSLSLSVGDDIVLSIELYGVEAHSFHATFIQDKNKQRTNHYNINCDISLLQSSIEEHQ
ncbi:MULTISPECIES: hypothetical protein [unclassified Shewanella]|uniref:hypothetical protein n=1 Tax=unclassified Shewanella TaxID=196818 RepID=UPI003553BD8D